MVIDVLGWIVSPPTPPPGGLHPSLQNLSICYCTWQEDFEDVIKLGTLELGTLSWILYLSCISSPESFKRKARRSERKRQCDSRNTDWSDMAISQGWQLLEAGRDEEWILLQSLQKEFSSADTLILTLEGSFQTSDFQNYKNKSRLL